jgi:hypothetical protein
MSKNLATFSDVKPFTRAAEMPSEVLADVTGCLLKKGTKPFLPSF